IWAAFVGLSYVYVDGVQLDKLKYPDNYKKVIAKNGDYKQLISKLEKFCSTVFAASFLIFMCTVGVFFFLAWVGGFIAILLEFDPDLEASQPYIDPILQAIGLVYLIDFIGLGIIKRIPIVNRVYYPFYRIMSFLTLSPLYRSIYYGFVSNHKPWKVGIAMLIFCTGTFFTAIIIQQEAEIFNSTELTVDYGEDYIAPLNYVNLAEGKLSNRLIFESDIIERNVAKFMIVHGSECEERYILKQCNYEKAIAMDEVAYDSLLMTCLENFILLELDGEYIYPKYFYTEDRTFDRRGLLTYLDLSVYSRGIHEIRLYYLLDEGEDGIDTIRVADVEFFKDALPVTVSAQLAQDSIKGNQLLLK
ncbi:MAG: hypothetical protein WBG42_15785, partial [Cryomorphaceae bacterium]